MAVNDTQSHDIRILRAKRYLLKSLISLLLAGVDIPHKWARRSQIVDTRKFQNVSIPSTPYVNATLRLKKSQLRATVTSTTSLHTRERWLFLLRMSLPFVSPKATLSCNIVIGCSKLILLNSFPIGTQSCIDILTP